MKPPIIPPDRAFAVDGVVDQRVRATLAEARRIRDAWAGALRDAEVAAQAEAALNLRNQLEALSNFRDQLAIESHAATQTRAIKLATQLVGAHFVTAPDAVEAQLQAVLAARPDWVEIRIPPGVIDDIEGPQWAHLNLRVDPALCPGELILVGPGGTVDARFSARLARMSTQ